MGLAVGEIFEAKEIRIASLSGKVLAIDSFNLLYQFLSTIRQQDGSLLMDSKGRVTSHLTGLLSRSANLMEQNIRLVFVFDGKAPVLKMQERERRAEIKKDAEREYQIAKERDDVAGMKKYASRTARLTPEMLAGAKGLITAMGCPIVDAPSEGEAQAAYIAKKGDAYATVSQDFDTLLYGTPRLIRNLSISGKRKKGLVMVNVEPEEIMLKESLDELGLDGDQLIVLAMLVGTDYNYGGIKGLGPKKALALVKKHGHAYDKLFEEAKWPFGDWHEIYGLIKNMPVSDDYKLEWKKVDRAAVRKLLCEEHEFSEERVESMIAKMAGKPQRGLADFF